MKITAEFNSNEELLSFISTFGAKTIMHDQVGVQAPKAKKEVATKVKEEKAEDHTPKVNAEIVSVETPTGEIIETDSTPTDEGNEEAPKEEAKAEITKEMVRAVFTKLIKAGKAKEAKDLTSKYGASKLPELKEEHYEAVYKEAEGLL